ncbi:hypothetical protein [Pelagicoccus sp. SDUM812003]|uniref:THUMP-like domain-containing protein n=1 Tax=Pelagicoccus sp. SDUM812003 TaxID=3041267 RepID=UPI00280EBD36|nr:hypothetical protein [Pelagicoccus sp. SDUM812003]MDQ8203246.1 hypothetical protein [Pelagicoccus sp. SDUM812003]
MSQEIVTETLQRFVVENAGRSPSEIVLMKNLPDGVCPKFAAQQIKARQRMGKKLPSWLAEPRVAFPPSLSLEQCSSEIAARYKASIVQAGKTACDLTGGFGVDARFLAERFERLDYFERDAELAELVRWNASVFGLESTLQVCPESGLERFRDPSVRYDLTYLDPARRDQRSLKVSALEDCEPNVLEYWSDLLARSGRVMIKASPGLDISRALEQLPSVCEVHVVAVQNDCKELLLIGEEGFSGDARIHCVNIGPSLEEIDTLSFTLAEEGALEGKFDRPERYLYEPNAAIMKAGAFKTLSERIGLAALNPRTRLYGSYELFRGFPGRVFEIIGRGSLEPKSAKALFPKRKANVISRNSGMSAEEMRKKLKLKDGGELFAIGAAVTGVGRELFACRLVDE